MSQIFNIDLFFVGFAVAAIAILGTIVFLDKRHSPTGILFLSFSFLSIFWSTINFFSYSVSDPVVRLWLIRLVLFFALLQAFSFFLLMRVFPDETWRLKNKSVFALGLVVAIVAISTLSPFVFSGIEVGDANVSQPIVAPGILSFIVLAVLLVVLGISTLIKKTVSANKDNKHQFRYLLFGVTTMFLLIIFFNLIFPIFFKNTDYIPYSALFILPFILFTSYAILKHHLLGIKVIATEILTFVLSITVFAEVIFAQDLSSRIFRVGVFLLVLAFGFLLIRSVRREVQQRVLLEKQRQALEEANQKLLKLDEFRRQVLSFAAHDMKSPIALMKQHASLIFDGTYSEPQKIKDTSFKIKMTADRAVNMIDNFLDIRKIEEGKIEYSFEKKNIVEFAGNITGDFALLAKQRDIVVSFESQAQNIQVEIDTDKMRQVLQNILDNSLKYTEAGSVKTTLIEEEGTVLIKIQDTGIGMEKEIIKTLFEQFNRDPSVKKKIKGTGLGLYISKQIVLAHHGEIWVESGGVGKGSSFFVRLKKA